MIREKLLSSWHTETLSTVICLAVRYLPRGRRDAKGLNQVLKMSQGSWHWVKSGAHVFGLGIGSRYHLSELVKRISNNLWGKGQSFFFHGNRRSHGDSKPHLHPSAEVTFDAPFLS